MSSMSIGSADGGACRRNGEGESIGESRTKDSTAKRGGVLKLR